MKRLKIRLTSIFILIAMLLLTIPVGSESINGTYEPNGYTIREVFSNGKKLFNYYNGSTGSYISIEPNATDKFSLSGTPSLQFRCAYKSGVNFYEYMPSMLSMPAIEPEKMALAFEVKLRSVTGVDKAYIGLTCYGNTMVSTSNVKQCAGVVRINLKDYANLTVNQWAKVVIPFKYFMENGEFICRESGDGAITEFDYLRTNGIYLCAGGDSFNATENQNFIFSFYDNIRFIEYINEPDRVTVTSNGKGADVSWSESVGYDDVEGYYLFRRKGTNNAQLIATLSPEMRHYTDTVSSSTPGNYTYIVQAFNNTNGFISLPAVSDSIVLSNAGDAPQSAQAVPSLSSVVLYDRRDNALESGSSTYVNSVESEVSFGGSGFFDGVLKTELYRDGVLIDVNEKAISEPAGITVSYNDGYQYTTLLPGTYVFRTGVYKDGALASNQIEKSFIVSAPSASYSVTVENTARQTIDGWGLCPFTVNTVDYCDWEELEDLVMNDLGINITRYMVFPESFDEDGNPTADFDNNLATIAYCERNGIEKYILTWLGPERDDVWTEKNVANYYENNGWVQMNRRLKRSKEEPYIDAIINQLNVIRDNNLPLPYAISIQNEPMGAKVGFVRPAQYERLVKMLDRKLAENGMDSIKILAFEPVSYQTMYGLAGDSGVKAGTSYLFDFSEFTNAPDFKDAVDVVGVHTYDAPTESDVSQQFAYNYDTLASSYGKIKWMTEFSLCGAAKKAHTDPSLGLDYDIEALFREITGLLGDVIWAGNSAWLHHLSYYANDNITKDGYCYEVTDDPEKPFTNGMIYGVQNSRVLKTGNVYAALKEIFNNAPKGSIVKRATTNWSSLNNSYGVLADLGVFENGNSTVVVLVNQSTEDAYITLNNIKGTTAEVNTLTSGSFECKQLSTLDVAGGTVNGVFIPGKSVNIIISK